MKRMFKALIPLLSLPPIAATVSLVLLPQSTHLRLKRTDWEINTKTALNQCLATYGIDSKNYSKNNYVVFDFDNTSAIFDIAHQCTTYQIERMCYNFTKEELRTALSADLDVTKDLTSYGYDFKYQTLIDDIVTCYDYLQNKYGTFTYKGVDSTSLNQLHAEDNWIDFSAKLRYMYNVVSKVEGDTPRCLWGTYQFSNLTPEQVYDIEYSCLSYYSTIDSYWQTWTAKTKVSGSSMTDLPSASFVQGISVTNNIKELYQAIKDNGMDIWIVSASQIDQVRAAADVFGLGQYVKGCLALTNKLGDEGKYIPEYDYTTGKGYIKQDGKWVMMDVSNPYVTSGVGKSLSVLNTIAPNYSNQGPIMCFGDSTGDFNFCTEFKDTKLVVCFNRADRSVNDGGGLLSAVAMYQQNNNITLAKANENGDTLYCLQGRNENNKRSFRSSNKTIILNETEEKLFKNQDNQTMLDYIEENQLTIAQAFNQLCIKDTEIKGIKVGFLTSYNNYHSR